MIQKDIFNGNGGAEDIKLSALFGWTKKLSEEQMEHLRNDAGVRDTFGLKRTMEYTICAKREGGLYCNECYQIAKTLGLLDK